MKNKFIHRIIGIHVACNGEVFFVSHPNGVKFSFCDKCGLSTRTGANIELKLFS